MDIEGVMFGYAYLVDLMAESMNELTSSLEWEGTYKTDYDVQVNL